MKRNQFGGKNVTVHLRIDTSSPMLIWFLPRFIRGGTSSSGRPPGLEWDPWKIKIMFREDPSREQNGKLPQSDLVTSNENNARKEGIETGATLPLPRDQRSEGPQTDHVSRMAPTTGRQIGTRITFTNERRWSNRGTTYCLYIQIENDDIGLLGMALSGQGVVRRAELVQTIKNFEVFRLQKKAIITIEHELQRIVQTSFQKIAAFDFAMSLRDVHEYAKRSRDNYRTGRQRTVVYEHLLSQSVSSTDFPIP
ncbi:hypothetical protein J6590_064346 [Homalodisca vitripennis]|nr:hypothetical protein J6590_064346 [Homalodisca vitripennis]